MSKTRTQAVLEYLLLAVCLCVIALRVTYTEAPGARLTTQLLSLGNSVYSLSISTALILAFLIWFVYSFLSRKFRYRFSGIEIGLSLFCIGAVIASSVAADKRAAITNFMTLLAPMLMAILLVQLLDSPAKIKIVLAVIAALGVVSAYECLYQFLITNQAMIDQYQEDPKSMLAPLGIASDTLQHWQFEHRLYSKDVKAFFTTSNSTGSFMLLASFAAIALLIERFKNRKSDSTAAGQLAKCAVATAIVIFGLALTKSKGAIAASLVSAAMFAAYLLFGNRLKSHKKAIIIVCLLLFIAAISAVTMYGLKNDRLPGGNSMFVRWQYWHSSAKMYADHPLTGVGPGNFGDTYLQYKNPAALEVVADPHSFLLAILTQYGPLGLLGFLAVFFAPLYRATEHVTDAPLPVKPGPALNIRAIGLAVVIGAVLLFVRPFLIPVPPHAAGELLIYAIFTLYIIPLVAFAIGLWLLTSSNSTGAANNLNVTIAALFCAVVGVLVHNLIDFAIFEPGVFTALCAVTACLAALNSQHNPRPRLVVETNLIMKVMAIALAVLLGWGFLNRAVIPVAKSTAKIKRAYHARSQGRFHLAHGFLDAAAAEDQFSSFALTLNSRWHLENFFASTLKHEGLLLSAEQDSLAAAERNRVDYKNFERLADVYMLFAENSIEQERAKWLDKAYESAGRAVELFPGSSRLTFKLAQIAEKSGKRAVAVENYKRAVNIENRFRDQFRMMYPEDDVLSRLGQGEYDLAQQQIKVLSEKNPP